MRSFIFFLPLQSLGVAAVAEHEAVASEFRIGAIIPTLTTAKTRWKFSRELVFLLPIDELRASGVCAITVVCPYFRSV